MRLLRWTAAIGTGLALAALPVLAAVAVLLTARDALGDLVSGRWTVAANPADAVVALCALAGAAALVWLGVTVVLATADELRARRPAAVSRRRRPHPATPGVPTVVRRLVALVVGVLLGSAALSATAAERGGAVTPVQVGWAASAPADPGALVDPGWGGAPSPDRTGADELVVLRGDTLWSLAEQRCGPHATPGEVLAEQQRLHTANADVIGDDPDLLVPGQVLRLP